MDNEHVTVDFIFPAESEVSQESLFSEPRLKCGCGCEEFALVSVMEADRVKGLPASRMFECSSCGEYRLG